MTFLTFGVEHYELEENTVQYKKNAKVPNFKINKTCHMGLFLMGHEKTYRNLINSDIR